MAIQTVLTTELVQGVVSSRSVLFPNPVTQTITGQVVLNAVDQVDPNFTCVLTLLTSLDPLNWIARAVQEWPENGDRSKPPTVQWHGMARRVRLVLDLSRPASVGATITTN